MSLTAEYVIARYKELGDELISHLQESVTLNVGQKAIERNAIEQSAIYIDGSCQGTDGGWGVVFYCNGLTIERGGAANNTTNNRMELQAAIEACQLYREVKLLTDVKLPIFTDSQYVQKGITCWINSWLRNGWKGGTVKNQDLWEQLLKFNNPALDWKWVKGHSGVKGNERADLIANGFAMNKPVQLISEKP
jgi:ribonuclease HI